MSLTSLNEKRSLLFDAVNEAKTVVGTSDFIDKVSVVSNRGFDFAVEAGVVSKDETLQIEELFSTTILTKSQIISELKRILGTSSLIFGPGPQELIGGDMTNGYFGEVSVNELFTGNVLASHFNLTQGTSINSDYGWLKFARYNNIIYIAKRPLRHSLSWNTLNSLNLMFGIDDGTSDIIKNDFTFICRNLTGLNNNPADHRDIQQHIGSEWHSLFYNVHNTIVPSQIGDNWASFTDSDLMVGSRGSGTAVLIQEDITSHERGFVMVGYAGISSYALAGEANKSSTPNIRGWRPVLALKQRNGSYSTGREHYPE